MRRPLVPSASRLRYRPASPSQWFVAKHARIRLAAKSVRIPMGEIFHSAFLLSDFLKFARFPMILLSSIKGIFSWVPAWPWSICPRVNCAVEQPIQSCSFEFFQVMCAFMAILRASHPWAVWRPVRTRHLKVEPNALKNPNFLCADLLAQPPDSSLYAIVFA